MSKIEIAGTDEELRHALEDLNLPTLLVVMAHLTGDDHWLHQRYAPGAITSDDGAFAPDDSGGYTPELAAEIRADALRGLCRLRDERPPMPPPPSRRRMVELMSHALAEPITDSYAGMLLEETGFVNRDEQWLRQMPKEFGSADVAPFNVIVVGAGMSGLCIGVKLKAAGIPFIILEKNDAVGGTWYENRYPDCGVDTPNHFYSYSFERNPDWSGYYSKRDELHEYFERCADRFELRPHIRLNTEVHGMSFDDAAGLWRVAVGNQDGTEETLSANAVVSAVGQLNRPSMPDIQGIDSFAGPLFHSARWCSDVDLRGRRVAVIGTGCSAVQLLPKTAEAADRVFVFQRTPHWITPNGNYYRPVEKGLIWALKHIPSYAEWHRARMAYAYGDRIWPAVTNDASWPHQTRSISELNDQLRVELTDYIAAQLGPKQALASRCTPDFPVFGKRLVIDNNWYGTLARDNVELVTAGIARITPKGLETVDGTLYEVDVIIAATGFKSNQFLWPLAVTGLSGENLAEHWGDEANAFKGTTVPGYPNFFCLYGPNTNIVHGGSIIYQVECQVHYVMQCLALMIARGLHSMQPTPEQNAAYNREVQALSEQLAWGHDGVQSWYKNSRGRVVNNSPFSLHEFWERVHDLDPTEYLLR